MARLTANTQVNLLSQQGEWCEIASKSPETRGFMACSMLGNQPLSLSDVGTPPPGAKPDPRYSPTRAFWMAPSVVRLQAAGDFFWSTMLNDTQRKKEEPSSDSGSQDQPKPVRFPIAEFDAMKDLMRSGVVAAPERRPAIIRWADLKHAATDGRRDSIIVSGRQIEGGTLAMMHLGRLDPVKPSLFKRTEELAPRSASVEQISAQFGIRERMRVLGGPKWVHSRHNYPRVIGNWDIGSFEINLEKPVIEYVVGRKGLASAMEWAASEKHDVEAESNCAGGFGLRQRGKRPLPDYPSVKDPLVWFYVPKALPYRKVAIKTYARRLDPQTGNSSGGEGGLTLLVMHEVDLDGDGIADLMAWEGMGQPGEPNSGDAALLRVDFANIAGEWHLLDIDSYEECT